MGGDLFPQQHSQQAARLVHLELRHVRQVVEYRLEATDRVWQERGNLFHVLPLALDQLQKLGTFGFSPFERHLHAGRENARFGRDQNMFNLSLHLLEASLGVQEVGLLCASVLGQEPGRFPREHRLALLGEQVALDRVQQQALDELARGHRRVGADGEASVLPLAAPVASGIQDHELMLALSADEQAAEEIFLAASSRRKGRLLCNLARASPVGEKKSLK